MERGGIRWLWLRSSPIPRCVIRAALAQQFDGLDKMEKLAVASEWSKLFMG